MSKINLRFEFVLGETVSHSYISRNNLRCPKRATYFGFFCAAIIRRSSHKYKSGNFYAQTH